MASNSAGDYVQCSACSGGYSVNLSNECVPICGDGNWAPEEACEDGNLNNLDGCDSTCHPETNFQCNNWTNGTLSVCVLTKFSLTLI
jgi:cysteine-rich repeat protein